MKTNLWSKLLPLIMVILVFGCEDDEDFGSFSSPTDVGETMVDITSPSGMITVSANFSSEMTVALGDTLSFTANLSDDVALTSLDINIIDAEPSLLLDTTINLSGSAASVSFDYIIPYTPNSLSVGDLIIEANVNDDSGNSLIQDNIVLTVIQPEFDEMFLLDGSNAIGLTKDAMDVHMWEAVVTLENMQQLLFATGADTTGFIWGDNTDPQDGIAELDSVGIVNPQNEGQVQVTFNDQTFAYTIQTLTFDEIFLLGNFNGWGNGRPEDSMEKVGEHDWIISTEFTSPDGVDPVLPADVQFKFVAGANFDGNKDWGQDPNQTPTAEGGVAIDGDGEQNIQPGFTSVPVTITFNDLTGVYGISTIASNFPELFILGNFTGWGGNDGALSVPLTLIDDNLWEGQIDPANFDAGYNPATDNMEFKFVLAPTFTAQDFGDDGQDYIADDTGGEANINPGLLGGNYIVQFNDETLEYRIGTTRNIDMYLIGNFSGWGQDMGAFSPEMRLISEDTWQGQIDPANFVPGFSGDYEFKIIDVPEFVNQTAWGPSGDVTDLMGIGSNDGGAPNFNPGINSGVVTVTFNDDTFEYVIAQ